MSENQEPLNSVETEKEEKVIKLLTILNNNKVKMYNDIFSLDKDIIKVEKFLELLRTDNNLNNIEL